jgi:hypothetical protein
MTRRPHDKPVKTHRGFAAEEVAGFVGAHKKAVREWIKKGFPLGDVKRPVPGINEWIIEQIEASRLNDHE